LQALHVVPAARDVSLDVDVCVESGMMVLLEKQVHLQNEGGEAAKVDIINAQSASRI